MDTRLEKVISELRSYASELKKEGYHCYDGQGFIVAHITPKIRSDLYRVIRENNFSGYSELIKCLILQATNTNSEDTTIVYTFLDKVAYKLIQDRSFEKETVSFWDISEACKPHLVVPQEKVADWASSRGIYGYFAPNISFSNLSYVLDILRKHLTA